MLCSMVESAMLLLFFLLSIALIMGTICAISPNLYVGWGGGFVGIKIELGMFVNGVNLGVRVRVRSHQRADKTEIFMVSR